MTSFVLAWPGTGRRFEALLVALATLGIFALYAWSAGYWIDLADEGYFLYLASRVYQGELPYRDFDTYYTPGVFYLYAAIFELFGVSITPVRIVMAGLRALCALLLYGLTRRVAPWPFAVLPFLAVAAVDPMPVFPEPHPAWPAMVATLLVLESIARHQASGRLSWVVLAGVLAGVAFLFKQNVGAFAALAVGGYLLLRGREPAGWLLWAARVGYAAGLGVAAMLFLRPALNGLLAVVLLLPLLATLAFLLWRARGEAREGEARVAPTGGLGRVVGEGVLAGAGFVGVTLLWLVPLTLALGVDGTPFGLFVGAVNQGALILPLEPPPRAARELALATIWVPLGLVLLPRMARWLMDGWAPVARAVGAPAMPTLGSHASSRRGFHGDGRPGWLTAGGAVAVSLLIPWLPTVSGDWESLTEDPGFYPWLNILDFQLNTLYLYLPALGAWAGLGALVLRARAGASVGPLPWYLLGGTLVALAMYPRVDTLHAMFAGPPLFVVGAWALSRIHHGLAGSAGPVGRAAVFAALLAVPVAAVAPHAYWRYVTIVHADPRAPEPPRYVPLGLERAAVLAPEHVAENVRGAVELVRAGTPPGEPFFAYPVVPLFNFLADRPNPTRFDHFLPGALTAEDMAQVIADLERTRPRYVLWDHGGVVYWHTEPANRPLSEYIWRCYAQVANFPPFLILERRGC